MKWIHALGLFFVAASGGVQAAPDLRSLVAPIKDYSSTVTATIHDHE